jgi:hypothetical protein
MVVLAGRRGILARLCSAGRWARNRAAASGLTTPDQIDRLEASMAPERCLIRTTAALAVLALLGSACGFGGRDGGRDGRGASPGVTGASQTATPPRRDPDANPPGAKGGPGTNWENPPGPTGGPGKSPDRP